MNQQCIKSKSSTLLRLSAIVLMILAIVASLAIVGSAATPTELTVDVSKLVFASDSGITVSSAGVITKTYDGSAEIDKTKVSVDPSVVPAGKDLTVSVSTIAWSAANAGSATVNATFSLSGADAADYIVKAAGYSGRITPRALSWESGSATASADYAIGRTTYAFDAADLSNIPAIDTAGFSAGLAAEVAAATKNISSISVVASSAGTYAATAAVTLSDANFTVAALPVSVTINKIEITALVWSNADDITYGDAKNVSVTAYDAAHKAYDIYTVIYPAGYENAGDHTLTAALNNQNFNEAAALVTTKGVTVKPKTYAVSMKDLTVTSDGKTPYTIGVEGEALPVQVKAKISYSVNGVAFNGTSSAGTYLITATLPANGNYVFTSGGKTVTELSATLTVTADQIPVAVQDGDKTAFNVILSAKGGLPASVSATAVKATNVKLPSGTKYAQSFQIQLSGAGEESYTLIVPLSYELYSKGCKQLSAQSLYVYDQSGTPVSATESGYTVTAADGYFKIEGVKGALGTITFSIAPQYSGGGIGWLGWFIFVLILLVILLIVMFFVGRSVRKSMDRKKDDNDDLPAEEPAAEEPVEETPAEEPVKEAPAEEEPIEEAPAAEAPVEEIPAEEEPSVEAFAAVAAEAEEEAEEAGNLVYIDTKKNPERYQEMLDLEAAGEGQIFYRYRKSYQANLSQADTNIQEYYSAIKNAMLHYRGVNARKSWNYEAFNRGRFSIAKIIPKAKTLYLYLGIAPAELEGTKYNVTDVSDKKKFEATPSLLKIKGDRKFKFALELIEKICGETLALKQNKKPEEDYKVPYMTTEELLEADMIRRFAALASPDAPAETYGKKSEED